MCVCRFSVGRQTHTNVLERAEDRTSAKIWHRLTLSEARVKEAASFRHPHVNRAPSVLEASAFVHNEWVSRIP